MSEESPYQLIEHLHRAIHSERIPEVKKLIQDGARMDHVLGMRGTALCAAIEARNLEIVTYLLQSGCDVNARDFDGEPPILLALRKDSPGHISGRVPSLDIIQAIIQHKDCNVNKFDQLTKKSAIHFAVEQGMVDALKWLIDKTGKFKCKINSADLNGNTPLHLAVHEGVSEVVQILVDQPECIMNMYNKAGLTPLHICANTGDVKSLAILLMRLEHFQSKSTLEKLKLEEDIVNELILNINAVTVFENESALHLAVRNGHEDIVPLLLENGANVNLKNNIQNTPLMLSMVSVKQWQNMNNHIPKALLKKGSDPNVRSTVRCRYLKSHIEVTPLIIAIHNRNIDLVKCLIENGADVNMIDSVGDSPLTIGLEQRGHTIVNYLLTECKGIDVNIPNFGGETCLQAVLKCHVESQPEITVNLVRQLIKAGAEILPDSKGKTVIERAIDFENHIVLDTVLQECRLSGNRLLETADFSDEVTVSLIHYAIAQGLLDIVKILLSHGADIDDKTSSGESNLHIACHNKEYKIIRFLVENGCSLVNEPYIFFNCDEKVNQDEKHNGSDSDSSDGSYYDNSEDEDLLDEDLRKWLYDTMLKPRTLKLQCLITIRKFFVERKMALCKVDSLKLPGKLKACIRYKE